MPYEPSVQDLIKITKWAVVVPHSQIRLTPRKREEVLHIGTLPLHCALLKAAKPHAGINRKVGPTFHKRVFVEKPVSKFTVNSVRRIIIKC